MTLPPLEPHKNYVAHRVEELMNDEDWKEETAGAWDYEPTDEGFILFSVNRATEQAEREWQDRMDVLLEADINNLELHR